MEYIKCILAIMKIQFFTEHVLTSQDVRDQTGVSEDMTQTVLYVIYRGAEYLANINLVVANSPVCTSFDCQLQLVALGGC